MSLVIQTDRNPEDVQLAVLAQLTDQFRVVHNSVGVPNEDTMPEITFVVCPVRGLLATYVENEEQGIEHAKREGAVYVSWTADGDFRNEVTV